MTISKKALCAALLAATAFPAGMVAPGDIILLCSWKDQDSATEFAKYAMGPEDSRIRVSRIVRDYSMFDRREAPQYFPDVAGRETRHS